MKKKIYSDLKEHIELANTILDEKYLTKIENIINIILETTKSSNKILIAGNGGSAADSQHFAAELVGRFEKERKAINAIALTTDSSIITSIANDYDFDNIFSRQIEALGKENDVYIAISTSGNSNNIVKSIQIAKENNLKVIGLLGKDGGEAKDFCDESIIIPSNSTARIQEIHETIIHIICKNLEKNI